ncbi:RNA polymerase sigma factor [Plantibacter flavus]|uniref:RNA polymerase sigma factor n=1 Tax=Plantibacter flavus TaxID=150123 RepID=UPI003F15D923
MHHTTTSDSELLRAAAGDDQAAFAAIFDRHAPAVGRYAWAFVSSLDEVQELVQETFITAWNKRTGIRVVDTSVLPWLLVTCRNHALNHRRRRARHGADELPDIATLRPDHDIARERLAVVLAEIEALPDLDRLVCELCLIEGRSYREAATLVGASVGSVAKHDWSVREHDCGRRWQLMTNDETTQDAEFSAMLLRARSTVLAATHPRPKRRRGVIIGAMAVLLVGGATAAGVAVAGNSGPQTYVGPTVIDVPAPDEAASALVVTFSCVDPGAYSVSVDGAPNGTMVGTCREGAPGGERFGFQIADIGALTDAAQRIEVVVPDGARFTLEHWYQVPKGPSVAPAPVTPDDLTTDPDSYPSPDPMTEDELLRIAAASDTQLVESMQERYSDFVVPQVERERFLLQPEWATVLADCLTDAGHPTTASSDDGLRNDRPTGVSENQPWDTAFTACSLRFPMDPRYSVPFNDEQLTYLYTYLVTVATPRIEALGGSVSTPPNLTTFIADYRTGAAWNPFWDVSGSFDRDAMLDIRQIPVGFYGADIAEEERAYRER